METTKVTQTVTAPDKSNKEKSKLPEGTVEQNPREISFYGSDG